jgi:hypothetical protein
LAVLASFTLAMIRAPYTHSDIGAAAELLMSPAKTGV